MQVVDSGDPANGYVLPPGRYFITATAHERYDCQSVKELEAATPPPQPANAVMLESE